VEDIKNLKDYYEKDVFVGIQKPKIVSQMGLNLYHYTSPDGLMGIVKSKNLFATRSDCLNDTRECEDVYDMYKQALDILEREDVFYQKFRNIEPNKESVFCWNNGETLKAKKVSNCITYIVSFSSDEDSISMWNYYVKNNNYEGYNIGIEMEDFSFHNKKEVYSAQFYEVIYNKWGKIDFFKRLLQDINKYYQNENDYHIAKAIIQYNLNKYKYIFKNEHFAHEKEIRLVIELDEKLKPFEIKYKQKDQFVIPYIEFPIETFGEIIQVTIGPLIKNEKAKQLIEEFLRNNNLFNVAVISSSVPVRY